MATVITIICTAFASVGLWNFLTFLIQRKDSKESTEGKLLLGLAHDRICHLSEAYINRGYVTRDEFENLNDYLYKPYREKGGNGTAERLIEEVKKLPIRSDK